MYESKETEKKQRMAKSIIVMTPSDAPLQIAHIVKGDPVKMLVKLQDCYDSRTAASKITRMTDIITNLYTSLNLEIGKHTDQVVSGIEYFNGMNISLHESFAVALLAIFIDVTALRPALTEIKTLAEEDLKWKTVAEILTDETLTLCQGTSVELRPAARTMGKLQTFYQDGQTTASCFLSPVYAANKLGLSTDPWSNVINRSAPSKKKDEKGWETENLKQQGSTTLRERLRLAFDKRMMTWCSLIWLPWNTWCQGTTRCLIEPFAM